MASNPFDRIIGSYLNRQEGISARKQASVAEASERKRQLLDPNYEEFDPELYNVIDGDTLQHRRTGEVLRFGGEDGYHSDSFESSTRIYDEQPDRFDNHRRTYAKLYGKDPDDVSKEDLVLVGKVQKARLQNTLPKMSGMGLNRGETDEYGRTLVQFEDMSALRQLSDSKTGASYTSPFNYRQQMQDIASGEYNELIAPKDRGVIRAATGDTASNIGVGLLKAANSLVHGGLTLLPGDTPKPIDEFFVNNQERLEKLQNFLTSDEQTFRQKMDRKEAGLGEEIYEMRKNEYLRKGMSDQQAKISAGYEEFTDRLEYLYENPGQLLDATAESLPYMLGVGAVGRVAVNSAVKALTKEALVGATKKGLTGEAAREAAAAHMATFQASKAGQALLSKVAEKSAVRSVAVTEGFTNASDAYIAVIGMSPEEAAKSEKYTALRTVGQSHEEALNTLAEGVFIQTLLTTAAVAGLASKATGAAGFEGNLFRRGAAAEKILQTASKSDKGLLLRGASRAALAGGRYTSFAGRPGLREAGEEAIQSGGGEFLSQLAQFQQGLIDEVGAGVGRATGEGLAVGFASGAGIQTISGGLKKLADADIRGSGIDPIRRQDNSITPVDRTGNPGGTVAAAQESTQKVTTKQASKTISELREQFNPEDLNTLNEMVQRRNQIQQLAIKAKEEGELSPENQKFLDELQGQYVESLDRAASSIQTRENTTEYTREEKAILQAAMAADAPSVRNMAQDNEQLDRIYSHTRRTFKAIDAQEAKSIQAAGAAENIDSKTSLKVAREKMGDGYAVINGQRRPGLKAHFNLISEAISAGNTEQLKERTGAFLNFVNSQRQKLRRLENLLKKDNLKDGDKLHEFTYKKGASEAYYNTLFDEFETMKETRDSLAVLSEGWSGKEAAKTIPKIPNTKRRTFKAIDKTQEAPAQPRVKGSRTLKAIDDGATNEEPAEQRPAEDNVGQSSPNRRARTFTAVDEKANTESQPVNQRTERAAQSSPSKSKSSESSTTEPTSEDVRIAEITKLLDGPQAALAAAAKRNGFSGAASYRRALEDERTALLKGETEQVTEQVNAEIDLDSLGVPELVRIARENGIQLSANGRRKKKQQLIDEIRNTTADEASQQEVEQSAREQKQAETAEESTEESRTTEESAPASTASAIFTAGDFHGALKSIAANSDNRLYRVLADRLAQVLEGRDIEVITFNDNEFEAYMRAYAPHLEDATAAYMGDKQQIVLRNKTRTANIMEEAFLHEAIHAAINGWMTNFSAKRSPTAKALHNRATELRKQILESLREGARANPTDSRWTEVLTEFERNKEEWITYAWSNPKTQEILSEIQITDTLTAWDSILRIVQKILGLKGNTALDHVLAVSNKIFDQNLEQPGRSSAEGSTYTPSAEALEQARQAIEAEGGVGEQAEAQPERSSETEPEGRTVKQIAINDGWWDALGEVKRLQRKLDSGRLNAEEVSFLDQNLEGVFQNRLRDNTVDGALAQVEQYIEERLDRTYKRTPLSTAELKLPAIIRIAKEIQSKGTTEAANKVITAAEGFDTESGFTRIRRKLQENNKYTGWATFPFSRPNVQEWIQKLLASIGMPVSVDKGFSQASKTARSLITAVPNIHKVLENPAARRALYDALDLSPAEEKAFEEFRNFRNEFAEGIRYAYDELTDKGIDFKDGNRIEQNPAYLLTDLADMMDPAAITAMAYESMNWLAGDGQSLVNDKDAIMDILGLPENTPNLTDAQKRLTTVGTLRRNVVDSLGRAAYRHLNIAANQSPDISPNLDERMEQAIGTVAVRTLIILGRVESIGFDGQEFAKMKGESQTEHENYDQDINFIRIMSAGSGRNLFVHSNENVDLIDNSRPGRTMFSRLFGVSNVIKEPLLVEPGEEHVPKKALRSLMKLSKKLREAIRQQQKRAWTTDTAMVETLRRFENIQDFLAAGHEYEQNMDRKHALDKDAVAARNRSLEVAVENALKWYDENETDDFYLTYFVSKTGRTHVGSTFINPQTSKIHRFIFRQKEWNNTVSVTGNNRLLNNFKIAVALGMDLKIEGKGVDKLTQEEVINAIDNYMDSKSVKDALASLAKDGSIDLQAADNQALRELLGKEGTHTLAALLAWQDYVNARDSGAKTFQTSLPMEVDGVTNGFAAGILQTPPIDPKMLERAKDLSRATGMFYDDDTVRSFAQWLQDPKNRDNYQAAARLMAANLKKAVERDPDVAKIVAENLGPDVAMLMDQKTGRDFAKNPLMIIAYGAGFKSVRKNMVTRLVEEMYNNLAKTNELAPDKQMSAVLGLLNRVVRTMNAGQRITFGDKRWRLQDWQIKQEYTVQDIERMINSGAIIDKETQEPITDLYGFVQNFEFGQRYDKDRVNKYDRSNLETALDAAYGSALEDSLSTMLEGIREVRDTYNHAVMLMNAIFKVEFARRLGLIERESGRVVGRKQRSAILNQMHREGLVPSIRTAYSESLDENLELTAYEYELLQDERVKVVHPRMRNVTRRWFSAEKPEGEFLPDTGSTTSRLTSRNPSMDVGVAGVVGTIHSLDGTNSADVFGKFGVLNVFDAWVMGIQDMEEVPTTGNQRFAQQAKEYNLGEELRTSFRRMLNLMQPGEGRFTESQKNEVQDVLLDAMVEAGLVGTLTSTLPDTPLELFNHIESTFEETVYGVSRSRDALLGAQVLSSQFSHDGAAYPIPTEERETPLPILGDPEKDALRRVAAQRIDAKARTLVDNLNDIGNFDKAVFSWLTESVRPIEALRVIARTFELANLTGADTVTELLAILAPHLQDVKIIKVGRTKNPNDRGQYTQNEITIDPTKFEDGDNSLETLLHEIVHAATDQALTDIERNNPDLLKTLNGRATEVMNRLKAKSNRTRREDDLFYVLLYQEDLVLRVGEYLAWSLSSIEENGAGDVSLLFNNTPVMEQVFASLGQTLTRGNTRNPIIRSSQDKVNNKLFDTADEQLLESDKLHENMEAMEELDNAVDPQEATEYKNFISPVMDGILLPGLAALQTPTFLQLGIETDGTKNLGEVERGSDRNTLRVQAAGAKLSNNGGMTNQEVLAHELYHTVTGYTIESDTKIRAELRKIYEYVKDRLTWEDFMPAEEDIAGDRAAVEQAAKDRYDYIFDQVQFGQNGEPLWDQLQEFAAIGLSNKPLALALSRIDSPTAAEPLWDGNILSFLVNLISRGLELLRGETLGTRRAQNSADALFKLSQRIVTINKQAQVRKYDKAGHKGMWRNSFDQKVADRILAALDKAQNKLRLTEEEKKQAGTIRQYLRMGTHAALAQRTEHQQKANREFLRHLGVNKWGALSEIISEVLPYNKDDRGNGDKVGFLDLLRHSKVTIDIARQRAIEHTRSYLLSTFDKKDKRTRAERIAMTNVVLRTDLSALLRHNKKRTHRDIFQMLGNEALVTAEITRLERLLTQELATQGASKVLPMYKRQIASLANYMTKGVMTERNGMKNAHNIVRQYNLWLAADRVPVKDPTKLDSIVDQLATLRAIEATPRSDIDTAMRVINHEMGRDGDNGFFNVLGMAENYYTSSKQDLFDNNPVQMRKGYVYDITDGDINLEVIMDTPAERKRMEELGMVRIGRVNEDRHDFSAPHPRAMYKGWRGANTWQKAVVSITSEQRQGASLFEVAGYAPKRASYSLGQMLKRSNADTKKQFGQTGIPDPREVIAIPVLNERGVIVDYTYEMSLASKQQHLKNARNNDYFDQVIPRMFGAIPDRVGTKKMNSQSARLIYDEWEAFKDSPEHNMVTVGRYGNKRAQDMFNVIPGEMKRELAALFRGTKFVDEKGRLIGLPLRDEAVNLVMGFRKLSILDLEVGGKKLIRGQWPTFAAKTAEKVWQEIMQLVRIKMAIINPTVVVGNLSSNFGILLAEGIPAKYIQAKTSEAIRSMRQYQRDIARVDKLQREIGVLRANSKPISRLVKERERLRAELRVNPVGRLVEEGLFTSIVEDVSSDEDTYREWILGGVVDKLKGPLPGRAVQLAKEAYMVPGSNAFNMAIAATQYGDFIGRYVKFKYDSEVKKMDQHDAINAALASFIYYDMPQNRWLQLMNDNGFMMFTKFFLRIQPVIAKLFQENPTKAVGVLAMQQALMSPFDENIGKYALFSGLDNRYQPFPLAHVDKLEPTNPSLFQWFGFLGL